MTEPDLLIDRDGGVTTFTLNRPDRLNALSAQMSRLLIAGLEEVRQDDGTNVVVFTGSGRGFCAGGDLRSIGDQIRDGANQPDDLTELLRGRARIVELIHELPQVTIAAVNGPCAGAGMSIACSTDLRFSAEEAVWNSAFLDVGLSGDFGIAWFLRRLVGESVAHDLLLRPRRLSASWLASIGLVHEIFPIDTFHESVANIAQRISERPRLATQSMLANLIDAENQTLGSFLEIESARQIQSGLASKAQAKPSQTLQGAQHE